MQFTTTATAVSANTTTATTTTTTNTTPAGSAVYKRAASDHMWAVNLRNRAVIQYFTSLVFPNWRPLDYNIVASTGNDD